MAYVSVLTIGAGLTMPTAPPSPRKRSLSKLKRETVAGSATAVVSPCARAGLGATSASPPSSAAPNANRRPLVHVADRRARVVGLEDGAVVLPGASPPDGSPLTHADSMSVPGSADR